MLRRCGSLGMHALVLGLLLPASLASAAKSATENAPLRCEDSGCFLGVCRTQAALRDPAQLVGSLRVVPWFVDGRSQGFKLFAVRPDSLAARLGLQNGDVLRSLNGLPVHDPATAQTAWSAAQNSPQLRLSLLRNDQTIERTLYLDHRPPRPQECPAAPERGDDSSAPKAARPQGTKPAGDGRDSAALLQTIACQGERCTLPRSTVERLLEDPSLVLNSGRLIPKTQDGAVRGYALFGIRPASLFDRLGLRNGDVVLRLAGQSLQSPESALAAYSSLRSAEKVVIEIERRGVKQVRTYVLAAGTN